MRWPRVGRWKRLVTCADAFFPAKSLVIRMYAWIAVALKKTITVCLTRHTDWKKNSYKVFRPWTFGPCRSRASRCHVSSLRNCLQLLPARWMGWRWKPHSRGTESMSLASSHAVSFFRPRRLLLWHQKMGGLMRVWWGLIFLSFLFFRPFFPSIDLSNCLSNYPPVRLDQYLSWPMDLFLPLDLAESSDLSKYCIFMYILYIAG